MPKSAADYDLVLAYLTTAEQFWREAEADERSRGHEQIADRCQLRAEILGSVRRFAEKVRADREAASA